MAVAGSRIGPLQPAATGWSGSPQGPQRPAAAFRALAAAAGYGCCQCGGHRGGGCCGAAVVKADTEGFAAAATSSLSGSGARSNPAKGPSPVDFASVTQDSHR